MYDLNHLPELGDLNLQNRIESTSLTRFRLPIALNLQNRIESRPPRELAGLVLSVWIYKIELKASASLFNTYISGSSLVNLQNRIERPHGLHDLLDRLGRNLQNRIESYYVAAVRAPLPELPKNLQNRIESHPLVSIYLALQDGESTK
jgi:hypothetical protein